MMDDDKKLNIQEGWFSVRRFIKQQFGKRPDINAVLFLIGMHEVGIMKEDWEKEEKQDLMHVGMCVLFEPDGFFEFVKKDDDGWPHYKPRKPITIDSLRAQEHLIKEKIVDYFRANEYI